MNKLFKQINGEIPNAYYGAGAAVAVGVSAISGASQAKAAGKASVADIEQQGKANVANIKARGDAVKFSQFQRENQLKDMEEVLGDKLSMSGLETLQRESTLKAATAETGTEGTSQQEAIYNEYVRENFQQSAIVRDMSVMQGEAKMSLVAELLNFKQGADALIFQQPSAKGAGYRASANAGQAFQSGFNSTYKMLSGLGGGSSVTGGGTGVNSMGGGFNVNSAINLF